MVEPEQMSLPERWKYLRLLQSRYSSGSRRQRSGLLEEAEQVTGRHRKSLIRLLRGRLTHKPRTRPRGRSYDPQVENAVRRIARTLDFPVCRAAAACPGADGPQPSTPWRTGALRRPAGPPGVHQRLHSGADMVQRMRRDGHPPRLARRRPPPRNPLTRAIPAGRLSRHLPEPGHFEVDLVHHAGD